MQQVRNKGTLFHRSSKKQEIGLNHNMERQYPVRRPTVVDFFCGAGGLSLGFEQAGFDIVLGVDQDGHHIATHERNFPYGAAHCGSVVDLDGNAIRKLAGVNEIDVVIGGPPCQGFSHMGLRDLQDSRNSLVSHYMRLVLELRPKAFLMENVPGLLSGETKKILYEVISLAESNGYVITQPVKVLSAVDFGVPQNRKRLFLLGLREDVGGRIEYPTQRCGGQPQCPDVLEAIGDLPDIEKEERLLEVGFTKYKKKPHSDYAKVARGLLEDPSDLSRPRIWDSSVCTGCLRVNHSPKSVELYRATPPGETVPGHKLPRLDPKGVAPTLRAGSDSTHGSYTAPRPIHPIHPRCITSREAARLHGYPDWFAFYPLKWHAYRQIGNSVCPPVARALGAEILNALDVKRTRKPPKSLVLGETFVLPDDRPRTLKRIPVIQEFPPVINLLFQNAFDASRNVLLKPKFTFEDVQKAISATGSNLHWVRKDTFVQELARSRRVIKMLSEIHSAGYTIRLVQDGNNIGEFVPIGTPGAIEEKDSVLIRIDEIHNAVSVPLNPALLNGDAVAVRSVVKDGLVRKHVWGSSRASVNFKENEAQSAANRTSVYPIQVKTKSLTTDSVIVVCRVASALTKARISQIAKKYNSDNVVALVSATSRHFVAISYESCLSHAKETRRIAFEMVGQGLKGKSINAQA